MKAISSFILVSVFILSANFIYAQEGYDNMGTPPANSYKDYPSQRGKSEDNPGMEVVKIDNITMFVSEGRKVYKADGRIVIEEAEVYLARRFKETEEHLKEIEARLKETEEHFREINETLEGLKKIDETLAGLKKEIKELKNENTHRNN